MLKLFRKRKHKDPKEELRELLGEFELSSFPATVMNVLSLLRNEDSAIKDIASQIESDPGMSVRVLKTVNSAAFGLAREVSNVLHAINLLGRSQLESLLVSMAVRDTVPNISIGEFTTADFWMLSSRRAGLTRAIARKLHPSTQADAFTAGLLQDMAVPVIASLKKDIYDNLFSRARSEPDVTLQSLEMEAFGYDHATIGGLMDEEWSFPVYLVNSVTFHHAETGAGSTSEDGPLVEPAIRLATLMDDQCDEENVARIVEMAKNEFSMDPAEIAEMIESELEEAGEFSQNMK
jgi:HD-like signal output (HDOD) protein